MTNMTSVLDPQADAAADHAVGLSDQGIEPTTSFGRLLRCKRLGQPFVPEPISFRVSERSRVPAKRNDRVPAFLPVPEFAVHVGLPREMIEKYVRDEKITVIGGDCGDPHIPVREGERDLRNLCKPATIQKPQAA